MGPDHVDIIAFYNEIFIPDVKPLLVELAPTGAAQKNKNIAEATNSDDGRFLYGSFLLNMFLG